VYLAVVVAVAASHGQAFGYCRAWHSVHRLSVGQSQCNASCLIYTACASTVAVAASHGQAFGYCRAWHSVHRLHGPHFGAAPESTPSASGL
jgi:hypothetical protein